MKKSFTLVELMIVIVIAFMLAFLLTPSRTCHIAQPQAKKAVVKPTTERFLIETHNESWTKSTCYVVTDSKTGRQYLVVQGVAGVGIIELNPQPAEK